MIAINRKVCNLTEIDVGVAQRLRLHRLFYIFCKLSSGILNQAIATDGPAGAAILESQQTAVPVHHASGLSEKTAARWSRSMGRATHLATVTSASGDVDQVSRLEGTVETQRPMASLLTRAKLSATAMRSTVDGQALVTRSDVAYDRSGQPYLSLVLRDMSGDLISARWWRYPYPVERRPAVGCICWFRGVVAEYQGERQLNIVEGRPLPDADPDNYVQTTHVPVVELQNRLEAELAGLDEALQALARNVLSGETYERYCEWPAAQRHHGALRHGLLSHSLRVAAIARSLAEMFTPPGITCDLHLVTAAALLHDIGKTQTLSRMAGGALPERAHQIDHVTLGILSVRLAAATSQPPLDVERLEALTHVMLAHHGRREWGAPVEPASLEAWLVHLADLVDARLWQWSGEASKERSAVEALQVSETG